MTCHPNHPVRRAAVVRPAEDDLRKEPGLRASDAEREAVVSQLREHGTSGRLDVDELDQRIGAAYAARTRGELSAQLEDLPGRVAVTPRRPAAQRGVSRHGAHEWSTFTKVSVLLIAIWALSGAGYFWPAWAILSWGLMLVMRTAPRRLRPW